MHKIYAKGDKKKCVVCHKKTIQAYEYGYVDGISIRVPVCEYCKVDVGVLLNPVMDAHLKGINQAVVMCRIITNNEYTAEIRKNCVYVLDDEEVVEIYCNFSTESEIKKAREEANLSRAEMARIFEIPIRTLEDWEYGKNIPSHWAEKLILEKLEMIGGKDEGAGDE